MTFGPVSPVKGNRCLQVALVMMLTIGLFAGIATFVLPSEAAVPPEQTPAAAAPVLVYGVGDVATYAGEDSKSLGVRRREVVFNAGVLAAIVENKDAAGVALALFDDLEVVVDIERSDENLLGVKSFSGRVTDKEHGHFLMSVDVDGRALLQVEILDDGFVYVVAEEPESGAYVVSEYRVQDLRASNCAGPRLPVHVEDAPKVTPVIPVPGSDVVVDVLVVYTPAAERWSRTNRTGVNNLLAQAFQRGNDTLENSDVDMRLRLVHARQVEYEEQEDYISDLDNLTFTSSFNPFELDTENFLEEVHEWRDEYGADLVMMLNVASVSNLGISGVAWLLTEPTGAPQWGFCVVSAEYADATLIHEIGHNLGCHHSRAQMMSPAPPEGGLFEYSTGWRWRGLNGRRYVSIMTYEEFDFDNFMFDTQVYIFSNPDIDYAGAPTGSYVGEYAPADNARSIREIKNVVAGYRPQVVPDEEEGEPEEGEDDPEPDDIWYVNAYSPFPTQDGQSWESPFKTITQALNVAGNNHEIWVARGLYQEGSGETPAIQMRSGVRMYGGFIGVESSKFERDIFANATVIDGNNERAAVAGANNTVLDGFIVVNGGMYNDGVSPIVRNCAFGRNTVGMTNIGASPIVTDCYFGRDEEDFFFWQIPDWGLNETGMLNQGGAPTLARTSFLNCDDVAVRNEDTEEMSITACVFKSNKGGGMINVNADSVEIISGIFEGNRASQGGAIHNTDSIVYIASSSFLNNQAIGGDGGAIAGGMLTIETATFRDNISVGGGAAIARPTENSLIRNARFSRNRAGGEGGALLLDAAVRMENCLVYGNGAGEGAAGAGIAVESGAPVIWNTTFARNDGYALHNMTGAASPRLTNCILWGNTNAIQNTDNATAVVTYSDVQGGQDGQGNIEEDPLFRDIGQGDMYLLEDSPCINSGTGTGAPSDDIAGEARPQDGQHDMGAWEYIGPDGGDSGEGPVTDPTEGEQEEGEGEQEDVPAASFEAVTLVRDKEALLPLHDWVPLFRFTMKYGEDDFAPRDLRRLVYTIINDTDDEDDRALEYAVTKDLHTSDILEYGLFWDMYSDEDQAGEPRYGSLSDDDILVEGPDGPFTWDHTADFVTFTSATFGRRDGYAPMTFDMDFTNAPYIPEAAPEGDDTEGNAYIVAVRTSSTWRSQLTLGVLVEAAEMVNPDTGEMPIDVDDEGGFEYIDEYSPDFYGDDPEILEDEVWYSSSFGVFDPSGPYIPTSYLEVGSFPHPNFWQHTSFMAVPTGEFTRPRWNKPGQLMSMFASEFIEQRRIIALEEWTPVIGINLHSTRARMNCDDGAMLTEVNIVLTDVGADPYGPEGNGGFNPKNALKPVQHARSDGNTFGHHVVQNGIWVWRDDNDNGVFEPPTPQVSGGVEFGADLPLQSGGVEDYRWEYIPLPPGGGDPWWKITLYFYACDRNPYGFISPTPNNIFPIPDDDGKFGSEFTYDYFVVTRFDSGFKDCSLRPATNTGATYGAEFRAFIEPKRIDPFTWTYAGGIFTDSQNYMFEAGDDRWMPDEPWWPERTLNASAAKPFRLGVEVHDMVLTYNSSLTLEDLEDLESYLTFNFHPLTIIGVDLDVLRLSFGHSPINNQQPSIFSIWMDPFGQDFDRFTNGHVVNAYKFVPLEFRLPSVIFDESYTLYARGWGRRQYAFEVAPFFKINSDLPPYGPRSTAYPTPPERPTVPHFDTWPGLLEPGQYPALIDWAPENARARLLTQKTEPNSNHVAMLGINASGSVDPVVNTEGNSITLAQIVVAFWGPDFTPDLLKPLDPNNDSNQSLDSGVLLWEKGDFGGTAIGTPVAFLNSQDLSDYANTPLPLVHNIIPVTGLRWAGAPEYIDLNGDGAPSDMDGNGIIDENDKAWVLTLYPRNLYELPTDDDMESGNGGCDLYITASTSENIGRFQQFRAVVPATLPSRAANYQKAGIQFYPPVNTSPKAFLKANGEEDPVAPYYGHDMLQSNIPLRIEDMAQRWSDINIGGGAVPAIGLNIATNREGGTVASGSGGVGYERAFYAPGQRWAANQLAGDFLIDERYESYEITGNTADTLALLSGTPRNGAWRVVRDPSFLEEVTVEIYQEGDFATMNPLTDLLPLDRDQRISGVALYRDNDNHPDNRNGMFDPDIDIPLTLDTAPYFSGRTADEVKVRFVFSTPGTSDFPIPRAEQTRHRQWVHDSFGTRVSDPENGPDFFVVLRASNDMQIGDNFRVGIVSWGPSTPSEPDPHIWAVLPGEERNDYLKFREFQWAERGVGFVTYFKEPPVSYYLHGAKASQRPDASGLNWIRSHSTKKGRSGVITARNRPIGPRSLVIDSASQSRLPIQTLPGQGFSFLIYGKNFGNNPMVALSGYDLIINAAKDDTISVTITTRPGAPPQEPVTLVVRNPNTGDEASRSDLFTLTSDVDVYGPKIMRVNPGRARKADFPVVVEGMNFFNAAALEVRFGETRMPVLDVSPDGTAITVGFPVGGMPQTGLLNVLVASGNKNGGQDIKVDAFEYI
ncbi:MAG TPA: DUF1565 domain-containing protein, partial [Candidatus Hydrogenedentes bacterium]|nr:DUF1565 domain-containing protein [Candidatus Hydrogenedentota bacterium]